MVQGNQKGKVCLREVVGDLSARLMRSAGWQSHYVSAGYRIAHAERVGCFERSEAGHCVAEHWGGSSLLLLSFGGGP
eukprot:3427867-Rhodomonas_salina.1